MGTARPGGRFEKSRAGISRVSDMRRLEALGRGIYCLVVGSNIRRMTSAVDSSTAANRIFQELVQQSKYPSTISSRPWTKVLPRSVRSRNVVVAGSPLEDDTMCAVECDSKFSPLVQDQRNACKVSCRATLRPYRGAKVSSEPKCRPFYQDCATVGATWCRGNALCAESIQFQCEREKSVCVPRKK